MHVGPAKSLSVCLPLPPALSSAASPFLFRLYVTLSPRRFRLTVLTYLNPGHWGKA